MFKIMTSDYSFEDEEIIFTLKAVDDSSLLVSESFELSVKFLVNPLLLDMN